MSGAPRLEGRPTTIGSLLTTLFARALPRSARDDPPPTPPEVPSPEAPAAPPQLILMEGEGPRARFVLHGERTSVGRHAACDLQLLDEGVRARHATLVRGPLRWTLEIELDALPGTVINGAPPPELAPTLFDGDVIELGTVALQFFSGTRPVAPRREPPAPRRRRRRRSSPPGLSGDLRSLSFCDLIQLLSLTGKTGELEVESRGRRWRLAVKDGAPVDVKGPERDAVRGFRALARLGAGRFRFHERAITPVVRLQGSTQALLLDALRRADEERQAG